jgi:hypothetical protein
LLIDLSEPFERLLVNCFYSIPTNRCTLSPFALSTEPANHHVDFREVPLVQPSSTFQTSL